MEWQVIKLPENKVSKEALGIHQGHTDWYEYEVLNYCETKDQAYQSMKELSKELNIPTVNY